CLSLCCLSLADTGPPIERGRRALGRGDLAAAERAFEEAVRLEPANPHALKFLGQAYSAQQKYREAEPPLRKACTLDPAEENACPTVKRCSLAPAPKKSWLVCETPPATPRVPAPRFPPRPFSSPRALCR